MSDKKIDKAYPFKIILSSIENYRLNFNLKFNKKAVWKPGLTLSKQIQKNKTL